MADELDARYPHEYKYGTIDNAELAPWRLLTLLKS